MVTKSELKDEITSAVRNMNRNIYEWNKVKKRKTAYDKIDYEELHGLAKNWLIRKLRKCIQYTELSNLFRRGNLSVAMSITEGHVMGIKLLYDEGWHLCKVYAGMLNDVFRSLDYDSLKYDGVFGSHDGETFSEKEFVVDFSSIERIKF